MNTYYVLIIAVGYWDTTVGKTDRVTPFLELIVQGTWKILNPFQGYHTARW